MTLTQRSDATAPRAARGWADSLTPSLYFPALDGLRALAVSSVFLYHLGPSWAGGGYLGVDVFFVISGYLITTLLLGERRRRSSVSLRSFWARRARRLLPALFLMLAVTAVVARVDQPHVDLSALRGDAIATLLYVANWHQILAHQSYFAQFTAPSPLAHTWSLAIEEQFYLLWPAILLILAGFTARRRTGLHAFGSTTVPADLHREPRTGASPPRRAGLAGATAVLAAASVAAMALSYRGQHDTTDVYFSTATRAFELLVGAVAAIVLLDRRSPGRSGRRILETGGVCSAALVVVIWSRAGGPPAWMYRGGFLAACLLTAVVIASAARAEPGPTGRLLAVAPLRYLGRLSYGIYLWHWPVIVFLTPSATGLAPVPLDLARAAVTLAVSAASYHAVEVPLRRARYAGVWRRSLAPAGALATAGIVVAGTLPAGIAVAGASAAATRADPAGPALVAPGPYSTTPTHPFALSRTPPPSPADPLRVMVVGDSVMWTGVPAVIAALQSTGDVVVDNAAIPGWGLTTANNWQAAVPRLIAQYRPQVVVGTWSWDNTMALKHPARFRSLLDRFVTTVLAPGDGVEGVVFFQFPPLGPLWSIAPDSARQNVERPEGVDAFNRAVADEARRRPRDVAVLDVASAVEVKGRFTSWLPTGRGGWERARMVDNTHFCPWGAAVYAQAIVTTFSPFVDIGSPQGAWWSGAWTSDPRYDNPPGACPDDQPPARSAR